METHAEASGLSEKAVEIVGRIPSVDLRGQVEATLVHCLGALNDLGRIHLPHDQFEERKQSQGDKYIELAPYVLAAVASLNRLLGHIAETYPAPPEPEDDIDDDFDLEFDLVDGPTGEGTGLSNVDARKEELDDDSKVADAAHAYGSMLRSRVVGLGDRLRFALGKEESWPLLAELDDHQHKLSKAVQGMFFGILGVFEQDARRDEILPSYRSAVGEAVRLRVAIADLNYHVSRFNQAIADATPEAAVPLVVAIADRLQRFSSRPEYRTMRAEDKKATIDFRRDLYVMRHRKEGLPMGKLRMTVEGFSKFLESMQAINHREVLVIHDRQRIADSLGLIERAQRLVLDDVDGARILMAQVVDQVSSLVGRNPDLDAAYRRYRSDPPTPDALPRVVEHWMAVLQGTLATVG
ncbi:MAG: hypothetical protein AAF654_14840 [Myxococcota bacterium]